MACTQCGWTRAVRDSLRSATLNDYGKFGLWHDCLYMGANEFDMTTNPTYAGVAFASFSRSDLYSGAALTYSLGFLGTAGFPFTLIPSNNQGKGANAAQPGTPNYFVSGIADGLCLRGQEIYARSQLRRRRFIEHGDEREPGVLPVCDFW